MIAELHPKPKLKALIRAYWWPVAVSGIFLFILISKILERFPNPSLSDLPQMIHGDFWFIVLWGVITLVFVILIYNDFTAYLRLEDGILERHTFWSKRTNISREIALENFKKDTQKSRWNYLQDTLPDNRVVLRMMEKCEIENNVLSIGRGVRDYHGFTFTPKNPNPVWQVFRMDIPTGVSDTEEQDFLNKIRAEMKS